MTERKFPSMARAALLQYAAIPGWDDAIREEFRVRAAYLKREAEQYAD